MLGFLEFKQARTDMSLTFSQATTGCGQKKIKGNGDRNAMPGNWERHTVGSNKRAILRRDSWKLCPSRKVTIQTFLHSRL